ncbi:MAG: hypothetical protein DDG59_10150 [Anaerolineae bacterium]|jgi:hypothetical protein|nr:MAG: hypothetical protein DDG59_10150 [Anaerolineae bacterium]
MVVDTLKIPFFSGILIPSTYPIARYLPPYYQHTVTTYLNRLFSQNSLRKGYILDPFGISPFLPVELANAGAAVIVCCNNPILRQVVSLVALAPQSHEFQAILAEISSLRKLESRLETFLRSLYHSVCNICLSEIEVEAYLWERDTSTNLHRLTAKQYQCAQCGNEGLFAITVQDDLNLQRLPRRSLIEIQAASKVLDKNDPAYPAVIDALSVYPTRALYALVTLLNKIDELNLNQRQRQLLYGLLIGCFDLSNGLWAFPSKRHRPKQLSLPTQFLELNVWKALEKSTALWVEAIQECHFLPVTISASQRPKPGEILIFPGRLKELLHRLPANEILAVVTSLPRPNQAFWTLSAIWSGWLEGKAKGKSLRSAFLRKRYDWGWHCRALTAAFQELASHLPKKTPCFALLEEYEANFLSATLIAADQAGFRLDSLTLRNDQGRAQIHWSIYPPNSPIEQHLAKDRQQLLSALKIHLGEIIRQAIQQTLEPAPTAQIHAVALASLVHSSHPGNHIESPSHSILEIVPFQSVSDYPNFFFALLEDTLNTSPFLVAINGEEKSLENRRWWMTEPNLDHSPLSDQTEERIVEHFLHHNTATFQEIDQAVCDQSEYISIPSLSLIQECLESYADYDQHSHRWNLRQEEDPTKRSLEINEMRKHILKIGHHLGYTTKDDDCILWLDPVNRPAALWSIQPTAALRVLLTASQKQEVKTYLVIPGSRVNLLMYKLQQYPFLKQQVGKRIHVIRFRQIRWLVSQPNIHPDLFDAWLNTDPIQYRSSQLSLW